MIRIAIVEDDGSYASMIRSYIDNYAEKTGTAFFIRLFDNAVAFLDGSAGEYDLCFFDIQMPYLSGMDAAKKLRSIDSDAVIVFITSLPQYDLESYEVSAADYILKPVDRELFLLKFARILRRSGINRSQILTFDSGRAAVRLDCDSIIYIESLGHVTVYHTTDGTVTRRISLSDAADELPAFFVRCKHSYIVNLHRVTDVSGSTVTVGGQRLTVGRVYKRELYRRYAEFSENGK